MALLTEQDQRAVAAAIAEVERHTDAELVTVLAARSDDYRYIPVLWAALGALTIPSLLLLTSLGPDMIAAAQLALFCILALVFRLPPVQIRLIPKGVRHWRAANMARRQFLDQGLHHTEGESGLLIFVSETEHYVEIIADRGISQRVHPERWEAIVADLTRALKEGRTLAGFEAAIAACGEILRGQVPKTPENRNELDNRLVLLGYD